MPGLAFGLGLGLTNVAAIMGGGAAPATGYVNLGAQAFTSPGTTTVTVTSGRALAAAKVAVAIVYSTGASVTNFRDSVDAGTAWTSYGVNNFAGRSFQIFKRIVPAGGFTTSTVFTLTMDGTGATGAGIIVSGATDATAIPTTTDSSNYAANTTSFTASPATSISTSYQVCGVFNDNGASSGPASGSDAGWALDHSVSASGGSGLRVYWRKATSTSAATINETENSSGVILAGWAELAL